MTNIVRLLVMVLAGVVSLIVATVLLLVLLVDPNAFRDDLQKMAREKANIELRLSGDLGWSFFPVLGFAAEGVGIGLQPGAKELAAVDSLAVGVKLVPLFKKSLQIDAVVISGLQLDLKVDKDGRGNWQQAPAAESAETSESQPDTATPFDINVSIIRISDSKIHYSDAQSGSAYDVDLSSLVLRDFRFDQPSPLSLDASIDGVLPRPLPLSLESTVTVTSSTDQVKMVIDALQLASLKAQGRIDLSLANDALKYRGEWTVDTFSPRQWMDAVGITPPQTRDKNALGSMSMSSAFSGSEQAVVLNPLVINLDDSRISGSLDVRDISRQALHFALLVDQFNLDRYQAPETTTQAPAVPQADSADGDLIPVDVIQNLELDGSLQIGRLVVSEIPLADMQVLVRASDGKLEMDLQQLKLLGGAAGGKLSLDARASEPKIKADFKLQDIALAGLLSPWLEGDLLTGKTSTQLAFTTRGNDMNSLLRAALGQLDLRLDEAVIHGLNINELAVSRVREKLGGFALLYPDYQEKLPSSLKRDTEIKSLLTQWRIEKGRLILPEVNTATSEGSLSLAGNIDMLGEGFDFRFGVIPAALSSNKYLGGTQWPIHCSGQWDAPVTSWCRADGSHFETVLQAAASRAAKDKASKKLAEELGIEQKDSATLEESVRDRAGEEEDRLKQKAKESINKKLNKILER